MFVRTIFILLLFLFPFGVLANPIERTIKFVPYPSTGNEIRVEAEGACGLGCGQFIKWFSFIDEGHKLIGQSEGITAYLPIEKDIKLLVIAELHEGNSEGKLIKTGGFRFIYDGTIITMIRNK